MAGQRRLPERAQGIDDENVRIEIKNALYLRRQEMTSQEPVIHFLRILLRHRRFGEKRFIHRYRRKFPAISITAPRDLIQLRP